MASKTVTRSTVVLIIWIGNTVNHLWNKHKHCSQRKIEAALLFSSSIIHGSAELFARGKNWNGVMVARFVLPFLARATFRETSKKMDIKNCQCYCKKTTTNKSRTIFHRNDIKMFKTLQWNFSSRLVAPLAFWTPWRHSHISQVS